MADPSWMTNAAGRLSSRRQLVKVALAGCLAAQGVWLGWLVTRDQMLDLRVYSWGGRAVRHDAALYQLQGLGHWFTYPPFSAVAFIPVAGLPAPVARLLWTLATLAALVFVCRVLLQLAGAEPSVSMTAAAVAAALAIQPVRQTLILGQINLLLMAMVLSDLRRTRNGRWAGIGIGLATAVKLTPGLFVVVLLLSRQRRSAAIAIGTFAASVGLGWLVAPAASTRYWLHLFYDANRVGVPYIGNQAPLGTAVRLLGDVDRVGGWYLALALTLAVIGVATAVIFARRSDWLACIAATGLAMLLVSPVSWTHHWVWALPALAVLLRSGRPGARAGFAACYVLFVAAPMWWTPQDGGPREYGFHGWTSAAANCFLIAGCALFAYFIYLAHLTLRLRGPAGVDSAGREIRPS